MGFFDKNVSIELYTVLKLPPWHIKNCGTVWFVHTKYNMITAVITWVQDEAKDWC